MTAPRAPKPNGVVWSDVVRRIEDGEPVLKLSGESGLHPLAAPSPPSGPVTAVPALDLDEDAPTPSSARPYAVPAPPARRGWLLRAIEGVFG